MLKNRIKEYRAKYDMKQEDLDKLVGVRREMIGNLEKSDTVDITPHRIYFPSKQTVYRSSPEK